MKQDIHPKKYRYVVFQDVSCNYKFLTKSTIETKETIKWEDGKEYPLYKLDISNKSHPYFTGQQNLVDTAGRIEKFNKKYNLQSTNSSDKKTTNTINPHGPSPKQHLAVEHFHQGINYKGRILRKHAKVLQRYK